MSDATDRLRAIAQAGELLGLDEVEAMLDVVDAVEDYVQANGGDSATSSYQARVFASLLARFREVADE